VWWEVEKRERGRISGEMENKENAGNVEGMSGARKSSTRKSSTKAAAHLGSMDNASAIHTLMSRAECIVGSVKYMELSVRARAICKSLLCVS